MKIQPRLTFYFTFLVMALIIGRSVITYVSIYKYNQKEFYNRLEEKARTTANLLLRVNEVDSALLKIIDRSQYDLLTDENISIYDSTNKEIYTNNDTVYFKTSKALFDEIRSKKYIRYSIGHYKVIGMYYTDSKSNAIITAGAIDDDGEALLRQVRFILFITLLASVIVTLFMGWFFVGKALQPISAIIRKVDTLSPVEHSERLTPLTERDEIAHLVQTFNNLFDKLEDAFKLQKSFTSNASHELFNPLTKIKSQLEVSLIHNRDNESYKQTMRSLLEDVNDLIILIQNLLDFSKIQSNYLIAHHPISIDELLFDIRNQILRLNPEYNIYIQLTNPPQSGEQLIFYGNKQLLFTAIKNIVENACKYSPDKSAVLNAIINGKAISLSIADTGPGISENEIAFIFEPFYRSSTMEPVKGFGIGLALADRILKAHNFSIKVESPAGAGTTFTIQFSN